MWRARAVTHHHVIKRNMVKCNKCGDVIESKHVHDFQTCSCDNVSVDGGHDYLRRCFVDKESYTEMSISEDK
jgi:acetyl-CoA carboxylase beta subunit